MSVTFPFFRITKNVKFKEFNIFGFKFKILRQSYRQAFWHQKQLDKRYQNKIQNIRNFPRIIRIGFLVCHIQKWKCQSVFDQFAKEKEFHPIIVVTPIFKKHNDKLNDVLHRMNEIIDYCKENNLDYLVSWDYKNKKVKSLRNFNLDVIFYEQPWGINREHRIIETSKNSLTCYVPYFVPNYGNLNYDCRPFHFELFRYYVLSESWKDYYLTEMPNCEDKLRAVGHPFLDFFIENNPLNLHNFIIFAPHHSLGSDSIGYSTFDWSGLEILKFATQHPYFNWIFKPHPALKDTLREKGFMSDTEISNYWDSWSKIGRVYEGGEYLPYFNDSQCLITDCGSFLVEYFYTENPVIYLISGKAKPPCQALNEIIDCYYKATNKDSLNLALKDLLIHKNDPLKIYRNEKLVNIKRNQSKASIEIVNDIKNTLGLT